MDEKNVPARIPEDSFFSCVFQRIFSQERGFGEVAGIPVFFSLSQDFFAGIPVGQEFLYLPRIPPDSCSRQIYGTTNEGFLFSTKSAKLEIRPF